MYLQISISIYLIIHLYIYVPYVYFYVYIPYVCFMYVCHLFTFMYIFIITYNSYTAPQPQVIDHLFLFTFMNGHMYLFVYLFSISNLP